MVSFLLQNIQVLTSIFEAKMVLKCSDCVVLLSNYPFNKQLITIDRFSPASHFLTLQHFGSVYQFHTV